MRAKLPIDLDLIQQGDYTRKTAFQCAQTLMTQSSPPTAIFAANDQSALGVIDAAQQAGLRVPDDLSIAGFDNIPQAAHMTPALTTVDQSVSEMGYMATQMLIKLIRGEPLSSNLCQVPTELIVRDSCRPLE